VSSKKCEGDKNIGNVKKRALSEGRKSQSYIVTILLYGSSIQIIGSKYQLAKIGIGCVSLWEPKFSLHPKDFSDSLVYVHIVLWYVSLIFIASYLGCFATHYTN